MKLRLYVRFPAIKLDFVILFIDTTIRDSPKAYEKLTTLSHITIGNNQLKGISKFLLYN